MPFLEAGSPNPEWRYHYHDCCVISALESMFTAFIGRPCRAPQEVYQLRRDQIAKNRQLLKEVNILLWKKLVFGRARMTQLDDLLYRQVARDPIRITRDIIPTWTMYDPEMKDVLTNLKFDFVNEPFWHLEKLVRFGRPVGATICFISSANRLSAHMFHLGIKKYSPYLHDLSDAYQPLTDSIDQSIISGQMIDVIERSREKCGFSALVISA